MHLDIWLGSIAIIMTIIGAIISTWPPQTKKSKLSYFGVFVLLGIISVVLVVKQSNEVEATQKAMQEKADLREKELRGKLDQSLLSQEYMRGQWESIGLMVGKLGQNNNSPDMKALAAAIGKMSASYNGNPPHVITFKSPHPGLFQIEHRLTCVPQNAVIQLTSPGLVWWQSATKMFDEKELYLIASDEGLTGQVLIWCKQ